MRFSKKLETIPPYLFAEVDRKIAAKKAAGVDVISFGVGDPDIPTPEPVIEAMVAALADPENHRYPSYYGLEAYRAAASRFMTRRFSVDVDPGTQVLSLMGSKEGIAHMALAVLDPGDVALCPEPGYPVYEMGTLLAGAEPYFMPLLQENGFLPDFDSIPARTLSRAKLMWINYPNNPTGAVAGIEFFMKAVEFAASNDIVLCHDNAYSEITYDGFVAPSVLEVDSAMDVAVEFHSLSKTFNMTGWRVGFLAGNEKIIEAIGTVKTNVDSGVFNPIQLAGVEALDEQSHFVEAMRKVYRRRRDLLVEELSSIGWRATRPRGSIYIWLPVPEGFDSLSFSTHVLEKAGVFFTPGNAYGPSGEGYARLSLTVPDDRILEAIERLREVF
jgi:LL-diaminopimelate aminotransferase